MIIDASDRGGIARYTAALVGDLREAGIPVALAAPAGQELDARPITHIPWGDEVAELPSWRFKLMLLRELPSRALSLVLTVRRAQPHVLHLQGNVGGPFDPLLMRWWHRKGIRLVRTVHDVVAHDESRSARRDEATWRLADVVIVHGTDARIAVEAAAPDTRVCVIPPDPPRMVAPAHDDARAALDLDDRPRVLLLGIIRAYKGIGILADAWPAVHAAVPDAQLLVVGSLPESLPDLDRLRALAGVDVRVGWLGDDDMLRWAAAADLFVLPYAHGVHSAILHNAVLAGTPVLASPPLSEEVERFRAGRVVPLESDEWSTAIVAALGARPIAPPQLPERGTQAAATAAVYDQLSDL